ncbi:MAG: methyltransferase domain-containing protein [Patescibacteria group bacterium]
MAYSYEQFIKEKIKEISKGKIVLDLGGGKRFEKWLVEYENLFSDCDYKTLDRDSSTNPNILADVHNIPLADESVDSVICSSVLEHVKDPCRVVGEIYRILRKGGKVFVYVPSIYPYHGTRGHYQDYWRFFDDTLYFMFKNFSNLEIKKRGGYFRALVHFFPFQAHFHFLLYPLSYWLDKFLISEKRHTTSGYYLFAVK